MTVNARAYAGCNIGMRMESSLFPASRCGAGVSTLVVDDAIVVIRSGGRSGEGPNIRPCSGSSVRPRPRFRVSFGLAFLTILAAVCLGTLAEVRKWT
jgi:hypothetical protein